jgi:inhibitor of cysteine peptidase
VKAKISTFNLTEADANKTIAVKTGDLLVLRLKSNATTGFSWAPAAGTGQGLALQGKGEYIQPKSTGVPMPGAPGAQLWRFKAIKKGQTALKLVYSRPWEKGVAPVQTWGVTVKVK